MAQLVFNIPNAALDVLDAYAQRRNYVDFHAYEIDRLKDVVRRARREENERTAADALAQPIPDVVVT